MFLLCGVKVCGVKVWKLEASNRSVKIVTDTDNRLAIERVGCLPNRLRYFDGFCQSLDASLSFRTVVFADDRHDVIGCFVFAFHRFVLFRFEFRFTASFAAHKQYREYDRQSPPESAGIGRIREGYIERSNRPVSRQSAGKRMYTM